MLYPQEKSRGLKKWRRAKSSVLLSLYLPILLTLCSNALYAVDMEDFQILDTLPDGLVIRYQMPELEIDTKTIQGETFHVLSFRNCSFTNQVGKAQVPIRVVCLGIPDVSRPEVSVLSSQSSLLTGYRVYPVENPVVRREVSGSSSRVAEYEEGASSIRYTTGTEFVMDRDFYRARGLYPASLAQIEPIGYVRQQRLARLELHPIQYDPSTGQLKIHKRLEVKITFRNSAGLAPPRISGVQYSEAGAQGAFESLYRDSVLNYEQARKWRKERRRQVGTQAQGLSTSFAMAPGLSVGASQNPGEKYKLTIEENGIYRLDYSYLARAGIDPDAIDPRKIELISGGQQIPIYVEGYGDGKFDPGDFIEFYGVKIDSIYTNENVYWLSWGSLGNPGAKSWMMPTKDGTPKTPDLNPPIAFLDTEHWESDVIYDPLREVDSEMADHFFWTAMRGKDPQHSQKGGNLSLDLLYRTPNMNRDFKLRVCFQGVTFARGASDHKVGLLFNGNEVDTALWERQTEYISETSLSQIYLHRYNHLVLRCEDENGTYEKVMNDPQYTGPEWDVYLNWIEMDYWRDFTADKNTLEFSTETIPPVTRTVQYEVKGFSRPDIEVFQIDRSAAIARIINAEVKREEGFYTVLFEDKVVQPTRYVVTSTASLKRPKSIVKDQPSTLYDPANRADYIIITHRDFLRSAERLADFRRKQGLNVIIVDVEDIYDEFSYGVFDPKAIKRFLRYAYFNWDNIPTYVLLIGDAHWDYKYVNHRYYVKYELYPRIYVPTYHAHSSPYGQTAMDHRFITVSGDDILPDMFIGRIPAETEDEADSAVDKIVRYENSPQRGQWQSRALLVADDEKSKSGDEVFENSRVELVDNVIPVGYEVAEVYLRRVREPYLAEQMIHTEINKGVVVAEYAGHGGAHHWAHEGIFSIRGVEKLQNYGKYPFVITTTCENGYFDNPMSKSIMEMFLLQERRGAVACLSATRLTYGQGNAAFDKILYPRIFNQKPATLGKIISEAKIDFINMGMTTWIPSAEQYTLFGDPATRLALPELDIECELASSSVDPSKYIELKPGYIKRLKVNPLTGEEELVTDTGFNAEMAISVVYPNNFDDSRSNDLSIQTKFVNVWRGGFDKVLLTIPQGVIPGDGRLRCYANSGSASAIGGVRFSVSKPVIEFISGKITEDENMKVHAAIVDNLGTTGIKSVVCSWHNSETWREHVNVMTLSQAPPDAPQVDALWYALKENIPLSRPGTYIDYKVIVLDTEGNEVVSALQRIRVPIGVNLAISRIGPSILPGISYLYSQSEGAWVLSASVENNGGKMVKLPVAVYFFEGNPDRNRDNVVDLDAQILGTAVVEYSEVLDVTEAEPGQWRPGENVIQVAEASIELDEPLDSGSHQIFAWINPRTSRIHSQQGIERVEDADKSDDNASRLFQINEFVVGKGSEPTRAQSLDGSLVMMIPPDSVDETVMSITKFEPPESEWKQPALSLAPIPEQGFDGGAFKIQLASGATSLRKEVQIDIKFDATGLRETAKRSKGLSGKPEHQLSSTEREWIELACQEEARKLGVFAWQEDIGVWRYLPSRLVTRAEVNNNMVVMDEEEAEFAQEPYVTFPVSENRSDAQLNLESITVDRILTPIGNWVIFFLDSDVYEVYLRREGSNNYERLGYGETGKTYQNDSVGLKLTIYGEERNFRFGDIFKFDTYHDVDGTIRSRNLRNHNSGDGIARVDVMETDDLNKVSHVAGEWAIFFTTDRSFEIHSQSGYLVEDSLGYPVTGEIGKELLVPTIGVKIYIHEGRWQFQFGDKIVFRTLFAGTVRAQTSVLNTMTLMHSKDQTLPEVQVWINKQVPQSGAVVAPRPDISILLSDVNGIDIESLSFSVSVNNRDFYPVSSEDYVLSERVKRADSLTNVPIFYSPILNIGKYRYRIEVMDFSGNKAMGDNGGYVEFMFLVEEQPDLSPPTINVTADGQTLVDGQVFHKSPEFLINIHDDHILDKATILLSLAYADEPLQPLEESEYTMTMSDDLRDAEIIYTPHLINGEYAIQVEASDTSQNFAHLSPPDSEPIRFRVDEEVRVENIINAPNPFSDATVFSYSLTQPAEKVTIKIYTVKGRLVRILEQDLPNWQYNEEYWDGRDDDGNKLASGAYLYKFTVTHMDKKIERVGTLAIVR